MNLGHLWICLVGITPSNNLGMEREIRFHQICLNNSHCYCKSMELRVGHFQTTIVKTSKLAIVFEQYKKISTLENSFQIMTFI